MDVIERKNEQKYIRYQTLKLGPLSRFQKLDLTLEQIHSTHDICMGMIKIMFYI